MHWEDPEELGGEGGGRGDRDGDVNPCMIHVNVWQNPLQYCKVISLQLIKIKENKKSMERLRYYKRSLSLSELLSELQQAKAITNFHKRSYSIIMVCLRSRSQEEDLNTSDTEGDAEMICRE